MIVAFDLDNCLYDATWRDHLIAHIPDGGGKRPEDFFEYNLQAEHDEVNPDALRLFMALRTTYQMVIVTARPERNRALTEKKLTKDGVLHHGVLMRPNDEMCPSPLFKTGVVIDHVRFIYGPRAELRNHVSLVVDDREDVCEAFHALGVTTLQIRPRRRG